jgi:hypothetical protein
VTEDTSADPGETSAGATETPTPAPIIETKETRATLAPVARRTPTPRELRSELRSMVTVACRDWTTDTVEWSPFDYGSRAAIMCDKGKSDIATGVDYMTLWRFDDVSQLNGYWDARLADITPPVPQRSRACTNGTVGQRRWEFGRLACYIGSTTRDAALRWTDERTNTYGLLAATDGNTDLVNLVAQWEWLRPR